MNPDSFRSRGAFVSGWRPEPLELAEKHWAFDRQKMRMPLALVGQSFDLRPWSSPRHNQWHTSSCTANAFVKALEIKRIQKYGIAAHQDLSRMAPYYLARELMNPKETDRDEGTFISLIAEAHRRSGNCLEKDWPFDVTKVNVSPSWHAMQKAYVHKIKAWHRIASVGTSRFEDVLANLAAGNPVVCGLRITEEWFDYKKDSEILTPPWKPGEAIGGHAIVIVGWLEERQALVIENSWGVDWGDDGFGLIEPEYVEDPIHSGDFIVTTGGWEEWAA